MLYTETVLEPKFATYANLGTCVVATLKLPLLVKLIEPVLPASEVMVLPVLVS